MSMRMATSRCRKDQGSATSRTRELSSVTGFHDRHEPPNNLAQAPIDSSHPTDVPVGKEQEGLCLAFLLPRLLRPALAFLQQRLPHLLEFLQRRLIGPRKPQVQG